MERQAVSPRHRALKMNSSTIAGGDLSKGKRRLFKLILVFFGLLVGLLTAEICLRIVGYSFPEFYTANETTGYALAPNAAGWYRKEGKSLVRINSDGLRDDEHLIKKPENTIRVAILGDSYAEALQVALEDSFPQILERKLQTCEAFGGKQIEVINFGVSGYGTAQEYLTLREKVWKYAPDIVILAMTLNNDITDNSRHFKRTEIPYFVFQNDKLVPDNSFRDSGSFQFKNSSLNRIGRWFYDNLRVVQALHEIQIALKYRLDQWKNKPSPAVQTFALQTGKTAQQAAEVGIDNQIYRVPADEFWNEAWRVTENLILLANEETKSKNAKFFVVTLSNAPQVNPNPAAREEFRQRVGSPDLLYPDKRIKNFGETNNISVVNLAPELQIFAERNNVFLHGFDSQIGSGHWNSAGHKAAGEILSEKICGNF